MPWVHVLCAVGFPLWLSHGMLYSMALVSLDLALLLSRQGRTEELKRLAAELMAIFSAQEVPIGPPLRCVSR